ncbi:hypothetical protein KDH_53340 [Dictyobacter sp. S3.2.2.5]|uniref:Uncharacterized protein n=1 Tax=Dictyobacter halimunensis TaxID=3026934 RepID=A0ABQ6FY18_9CHLR|nr:hypothetical protein KDH_53340 [Dictyobacter sp. S3.2.2.5]
MFKSDASYIRQLGGHVRAPAQASAYAAALVLYVGATGAHPRPCCTNIPWTREHRSA